MEFDRDLRARQEVRLLAQQAQQAFEGLQKLDQSGLDRITEALSRAGALHAAELAREAGVAVESLTWSRFFLQNLLPVTAGNLIGGCGFAALIWSVYHPRGPLERRPLAGDREAADLSVQ